MEGRIVSVRKDSDLSDKNVVLFSDNLQIAFNQVKVLKETAEKAGLKIPIEKTSRLHKERCQGRNLGNEDEILRYRGSRTYETFLPHINEKAANE